LVKRYTINCKLCGQTHYPVFGKKRLGALGIVSPTKIVVPYKCPVTDKNAEVTYPFNQQTNEDIYDRGIVGWSTVNE
jgi:hypothetical protein